MDRNRNESVVVTRLVLVYITIWRCDEVGCGKGKN